MARKMLRICIVASLLFIGGSSLFVPRSESAPETSGISAAICTWKGNASAAVTFTFDDGLRSQSELAAPILSDNGINGTFFIYTDNIGVGSNWSEWQKVADLGHEIGSHTVTHPDLRSISDPELLFELASSKERIMANLSGVECETLCYPYGYYDDRVSSVVKEYYIAARADTHNSTIPRPESANPKNSFGVVPCEFGSTENASVMGSFLDRAVDQNGWLVEMIHDIDGAGYDPVDLDEFVIHAKNVTERDDVWADTFASVMKYVRERQGSSLRTQKVDGRMTEIEARSNLDRFVYDEGLTLKVCVPSDYHKVKVHYPDRTITIPTERSGLERTFLMDVIINRPLRIEKDNEPPSQPEGVILIGGTHDPSPDISWMASRDPEGDPVSYMLELYTVNGTLSWSAQTGLTSINVSKNLLFGAEYILVMCANDGYGLSEWTEMRFNLTNSPPYPITGYSLESAYTLRPRLRFDPSGDPDLDPVRHYLRITEKGSSALTLDLGCMDVRYDRPLNFSLKDHTEYDIELWAQDEFGAKSATITEDVYINIPPMPLDHVAVTDAVDQEDSTLLKWIPSTESDLAYYGIYRMNGESIGPLIRQVNGTQFIDRSAPDGMEHAYLVIPFDYDGLGDVGNATAFKGLAIDDLAPEKMESLIIRPKGGSIFLQWGPPSNDDLAGFSIYRSQNILFDARNLTPLATLMDKNATSWTDHGVSVGKTYYYSVAAFDEEGNEETRNLIWMKAVAQEGSGEGPALVLVLALALAIIGIAAVSFFILRKKAADPWEE